MADSPALSLVCEQLIERYGELGKGAAERLRRWLSGTIPFAHPEILEKHLDPERVPLLFDAFWQVLPFGTGGRRGPVGYGANRMNEATVAMTVQGHCQYLRSAFPDRERLTVVVAGDVRVFNDNAGRYRFLGGPHPLLGVSSRSLGRLACEIYAGNGVTAYFAEPDVEMAVLTTPELSYLISELGAVGGINLSASHNPPDDNGIKVYDQYGSQPIPPHDQHLVDTMEKATEPKRVSFAEARERGLVLPVPAEYHHQYVEAYRKLYGEVWTPDPEIPIVYTPLCGCGDSTVGDVLRALGFPLLIPEDQKLDGSFGVIPFKAPNPEVPQSTAPARQFADQHGAGVVLSSDPDADRVGCELRLRDGSWYHFDGNQIAAVLGYYLMLDPRGPRRQGLVIETLVTTKILGKVCEVAGDSPIVDNLLVGFKYVAEVLKKLAAEGRYENVTSSPDRLVLAAEESHGVVMLPTIRDKDATPACMYLAALYQQLYREGKNLLDYYVQILERLGGYDCVNRSIMMVGADGVTRRDRIMTALRAAPPRVLGGEKVHKVVDYWDETAFGKFLSLTDQTSRNVLQVFSDSFVITVRPSGTEPKLKLYVQLLPAGASSGASGEALLAEVRRRADELARRIYNDLLATIDFSLSDAALFLPDIIDLDCKSAFDQKTVPQLDAALQAGEHADLEALLDWLHQQVAAMTPGSNPLPALKAPLGHLLATRWAELPREGLVADLAEWVRG